MSEEKPLNDRQRRFAEFVVSGDPATAAYEKAGYKGGKSAEANSARLMENDKVGAYIAELRAAASEAAGMTRDEVVKMLAGIIRSKPEDARMDNPLCELKMSKAGPFAGFPDKARSLERLCKMLGWDAPDKLQHMGEVRIIIGGDAK